MGRPERIAAARTRGVIRRFVRNVWRGQSLRQVAREYSAVMIPLASARRHKLIEYHNFLQTPDAQRVSKRLLQRLLCLANWSTRAQGYRRRITGRVSVAVYMLVLRSASHPQAATGPAQALGRSSLALVQYVEEFVRRLGLGVPVSEAMQCKRRLSSLVVAVLNDVKEYGGDSNRRLISAAQEALERLEGTRADRDGFSVEQNQIIDFNVAHLRRAIRAQADCGPVGLDPNFCSASSSAPPREPLWLSGAPEVQEFVGNCQRLWGNEQLAHEIYLRPDQELGGVVVSQAAALPSTVWAKVSQELMRSPPLYDTLLFLLGGLVQNVAFLRKNAGKSAVYQPRPTDRHRVAPAANVLAVHGHYDDISATVQSLVSGIESVRGAPGRSRGHCAQVLSFVADRVTRFFDLVHRVNAVTESLASMAATTRWHDCFRRALCNGMGEPSSFLAVCARAMWECTGAIVTDYRSDSWRTVLVSLRRDGADYFRMHLQRRLSGSGTPETTRFLVRAASHPCCKGGDLLAGRGDSYRSLVYSAWIDAVVGYAGPSTLPELCLLDRERIEELHRAFHLDLTAVVVLRTAYESVPDAKVLQEVLRNVMQRCPPTPKSEELLQLGRDVLSLSVDPQSCAAIVDRIGARVQSSHPFYRAAAQALRQVWMCAKDGGASALMEGLCPRQLLSLCCASQKETLLEMLQRTAARLRPLVVLSIQFHADRYNRIITGAVRDGSIAP